MEERGAVTRAVGPCTQALERHVLFGKQASLQTIIRYYITHRSRPMRQCQMLSQFKLKLSSKFPNLEERNEGSMRVSKGVLADSPRGTRRVLWFPLRCFVTGSRCPALFRPREVCDGNDEEAVKEAHDQRMFDRSGQS